MLPETGTDFTFCFRKRIVAWLVGHYRTKWSLSSTAQHKNDVNQIWKKDAHVIIHDNALGVTTGMDATLLPMDGEIIQYQQHIYPIALILRDNDIAPFLYRESDHNIVHNTYRGIRNIFY